jgi:hypothetical protein
MGRERGPRARATDFNVSKLEALGVSPTFCGAFDADVRIQGAGGLGAMSCRSC